MKDHNWDNWNNNEITRRVDSDNETGQHMAPKTRLTIDIPFSFEV